MYYAIILKFLLDFYFFVCIVYVIGIGWVAEWSIAAVLKTVEGQPSGSSNLSPSAINASLEAFFLCSSTFFLASFKSLLDYFIDIVFW